MPFVCKQISTANPPFSYLTVASYQAMDKVKALRASGEQCYLPWMQGPNVKVLCLEEALRPPSRPLPVRTIRGHCFTHCWSCQMPKQSVNQVTVKTGGKPTLLENTSITPGQTALIQFYSHFHVSRGQGLRF